MLVGVVSEIKRGERRCALTPAGAAELVGDGHDVIVQNGAGAGSGYEDEDFSSAGARLADDPSEVWQTADLLLKVKEPVPAEYHRLRNGQILFTYLHLAADRPLTDALLTSGTTAVAYETVVDEAGRLPLLAPMSELAGRLLVSSRMAIEEELRSADAVIGAVLVPGASAPRLVTRAGLALLPRRAVLVDVAIDQGGCFETSRPTTHDDPVYEVDEILHYCVANMPGAAPRTATRALTSATLPYVRRIAGLGIDAAIALDPGIVPGVNVREGELLCPPVAEAFGLPVAA
jgi:alanine dehydrogenase